MAIIEPDLSDVNKPLDPGTYPAKIQSCETGISAKGNAKIVPLFAVEAGGRTYSRKADLVTSGSAAFQFESLLRACNFDPARFKGENREKFDTDRLIGQELIVVVEHEMYNGETRDKVKGFLPK